MCGEHLTAFRDAWAYQGSSPHVRGTPGMVEEPDGQTGIIPACAGNTVDAHSCSQVVRDHPRMCGEHPWRGRPAGVCAGIIPACAGNTLGAGDVRLEKGDHPRMCGEHTWLIGVAPSETGSSPHVRGTLPRRPPRVPRRGIIPACAGNTWADGSTSSNLRDHPRMCGEHVTAARIVCIFAGSSPHVRGTPYRPFGSIRVRGIIPACAGNTIIT